MKMDMKLSFINNLTQEFFKSDLIIINSRIYTDTKLNLIKKKLNLRSNHNFLRIPKKNI